MDARGTLLFPLRGSVSGIRRRLLSIFGAPSGRSVRLIGDLIFYAVEKRSAKIFRVFDNTRTVFLKSRRLCSVVSPLAEVSLPLPHPLPLPLFLSLFLSFSLSLYLFLSLSLSLISDRRGAGRLWFSRLRGIMRDLNYRQTKRLAARSLSRDRSVGRIGTVLALRYYQVDS